MIILFVILSLAVVVGIAVMALRLRALQHQLRELHARHRKLSSEVRAQQDAASIINSALTEPSVPEQQQRPRLRVIHGGKAVWSALIGCVASLRAVERPAVVTTALTGATVAAVSALVISSGIGSDTSQASAPETEPPVGTPRLLAPDIGTAPDTMPPMPEPTSTVVATPSATEPAAATSVAPSTRPSSAPTSEPTPETTPATKDNDPGPDPTPNPPDTQQREAQPEPDEPEPAPPEGDTPPPEAECINRAGAVCVVPHALDTLGSLIIGVGKVIRP